MTQRQKPKVKRHIVVTAILLLYLAVMAILFGKDLLRQGQYFRFYATIGLELIVIAGCFFALKRRYRDN